PRRRAIGTNAIARYAPNYNHRRGAAATRLVSGTARHRANLASWARRTSEELHFSTARGRVAEGLFWPWSVSISCDVPYWRPPSPSQYGRSSGADGLQARFKVLRSTLWRLSELVSVGATRYT